MLRTANETDITVVGEVTLPLRLDGRCIRTPAFVSPEVEELMLGLNWLCKHRCMWDFAGNKIYVEWRLCGCTGCTQGSLALSSCIHTGYGSVSIKAGNRCCCTRSTHNDIMCGWWAYGQYSTRLTGCICWSNFAARISPQPYGQNVKIPRQNCNCYLRGGASLGTQGCACCWQHRSPGGSSDTRGCGGS